VALLYKPVRANIASADGKKKWHPHLVKRGTVDLMKIAVEIAGRSSLTPGDVYNVIQNLFSSMQEHLLNSETVKLDGLGRFTVKAHSEGNGVDTSEEVSKRVIGSYIIPMIWGAKFIKTRELSLAPKTKDSNPEP